MKSSVKQKGKRLNSRRICGVMLRCSLLVRKSGVRSSTCSLFFENESGSKCKITVMQNLINPGLRPKPQPQGPNPRPQGSNPRFKTPIKTLNLNPSLEAQIPACKPIFQPSYPYPKSEPQDSSPSAKHRSSGLVLVNEYYSMNIQTSIKATYQIHISILQCSILNSHLISDEMLNREKKVFHRN